MSQSNSRRKVQPQDLELWEMYEEEERSSTRQRQDRNGRRNSRGETAGRSSQRSRQSREASIYGRRISRDRERTGSAGRSSYGGEVAESAGRSRQNREAVRNAERNNRVREAEASVRRNSRVRETEVSAGRNSRVRETEVNARRNSRVRETEVSARRNNRSRNIRLYEVERDDMRQEGRATRTANRQSVNAAGVRHTGRSRDASQVSYIQPYSNTGNRRRNAEYAYRGNARPVQSIKRRRARRRRELLSKVIMLLFVVICLGMIYYITGQIYQIVHRKTEEKFLPVATEQVFDDEDSSDGRIRPPEVIQDFLEVNEYSRPGTKLDKINSIFVHYTANPGTSAAQNRSYFANLAETHERSASAHLIIGYDGELIQCIPFDEQAYAVMTRNEDSISIECCYLSEDGSFTQETYDTLIHTLAWLVEKYDLSVEDILRHYDCGGKKCPLYYAENEGEWERLRQDVAAYLATGE